MSVETQVVEYYTAFFGRLLKKTEMFKFKLFLFVVTISGHGIDFGGTSGYTDLSNFTTAYKGKVSSGGGHNLRLIEEEDELWNNRTSRHLFNFLGSHRHEVAGMTF